MCNSSRGVGDDVLRRRRLVVGDVVDLRARRVRRWPRAARLGDVVDVDAVEHLARLDDALRRALAQAVDGAAARPVDAGEAEDLRALAAAVRRARATPPPPRRAGGRARRRARVGVVSSTQAPPLVAVDADGRQVADPAQIDGARARSRGVVAQHGVAVGVGRHRDEHVRRAARALRATPAPGAVPSNTKASKPCAAIAAAPSAVRAVPPMRQPCAREPARERCAL